MYSAVNKIASDALVTEIVAQDYRTAGVFKKYGIDYCCGGRRPLAEACNIAGVDLSMLENDLSAISREVPVSSSINFSKWPVAFLIDYIVNIHHAYLREALPETRDLVFHLMESHKNKYPYLSKVYDAYLELHKELIPHLEHEEKIIFPYIKQVANAYESKETYAALLVRTLRKPIEQLMVSEHHQVATSLTKLRDLTDNYAIPQNACITHKVCLKKLNELDNDIVQHVHLENNILFPRAVAMEQHMLQMR